MKNRFKYNGSIIITDSNLYGGVSYYSSIERNSEYKPGVATMCNIKFITTYSSLAVGNKIIWESSIDGTNYIQRGVYNVVDIVRVRDKYSVTCYDNMYLLDNIDFGPYWYTADGSLTKGIYPLWYDTYTGTYTLLAVFRKIREVVGTSYMPLNPNFNNDDFVLDKKRFSCNNITCRQVLAYLAGAAGGIAYADANGLVKIRSVGITNTALLTRNQYKEASISDYKVEYISGVSYSNTLQTEKIKSNGLHYDDDSNLLNIVGNPFLFFDNLNKSDVVDALNNIYDFQPDFKYTPFKIKLFSDVYNNNVFNVGDKIQFKYLDSNNTEITVSSIILEKYIDLSNISLSCVQKSFLNLNVNSSSNTVINSSIQQIENTIEGFTVKDPTTGTLTIINGDNIKTGSIQPGSGQTLKVGGWTITDSSLEATNATTGTIKLQKNNECARIVGISGNDVKLEIQGNSIKTKNDITDLNGRVILPKTESTSHNKFLRCTYDSEQDVWETKWQDAASYGTYELTPGTSSLPKGTIYLLYEV